MLILLLAASMLAAPPENQLAPISGSIAGTVSAVGTYEPVPGAIVTAYQIIQKQNLDLELKQTKTMATNARGEYRFESLPAGNYLLRAKVLGFYDGRMWDVQVSNDSDSKIDLFVQVMQIGDYEPGEGPEIGAIYGVVNSILDKPAADVLISAFCADTMGPAHQTRTDKKGEFNLNFLPYGRYVVIYSKAHSGFGSIGIEVHGKEKVKLNLQ